MEDIPERSITSAPSLDYGEVVEPRVPAKLYVLKDGDSFIVADAYGNIVGEGDGFFHNDTRILSDFGISMGDQRPPLLSAGTSRDNVLFTSHMTNRPLTPLGGRSTPEGVIHLERTRFLWRNCLHERITCTNYGQVDTKFPIAFTLAADFSDTFEVRGTVRPSRGDILPIEADGGRLVFRYRGLDEVIRTTTVMFSEAPAKYTDRSVEFEVNLPANSSTEIYISVAVGAGQPPDRRAFRNAAASARRSMRSRLRRSARLRSSGHVFNEWIERSRADLALLTSELPTGLYPYAGIPWFSTPFGRDAVVTGMQTLWINPDLSRGVLTFLACNQASETSPFYDSAPGKIMHETRKGEMTALRELPFGRYYGGVDTTPLFVMLAGAYAERTNDMAFIDELWPSLVAAMAWIDRVAGEHPDGFLTYARAKETGLANQGWKDSEDSVFHADGRFPEGPIALVEVQGYTYAARCVMADLAERRNDAISAVRWRAKAEALRSAVENRYWMEEQGFYGMAIDGSGALCEVYGSNPGHLLFTGLPDRDRGARVAQHLISAAFNTGWGVRTLAYGQPRLNPMSYHNGSVWPHDTALCAAGFARYGFRDHTVRLLSQMFEAAVHFEMRLPELFCGFGRAPGEAPIAYPVACLPQAWAAGSIFMLLQATLGLHIDGRRGEIHIDQPRLPPGIDHFLVQNLVVGRGKIDIAFQRVGERVVAFPQGPGKNEVPVLLKT